MAGRLAVSLRLATRSSPLALEQARMVADGLVAQGGDIDVEIVPVQTSGDRRHDVPIHSIGGQGVFVKEVDQAVIDRRADLSVHSAKDLPSAPPSPAALTAVPTAGSLPIAAVLRRADPRDALVGTRLDELRPGATVATGSVRRRAQLAWLRPDLDFAQLRGNMATRLSKVPAGGAVVVAAAALERLGRLGEAAQIFDPLEMLPQVGQGVIAVCCRPDDETTRAAVECLDDAQTRFALRAERAWLASIGGRCDLPVAAFGRFGAEGPNARLLRLDALVASLDGHMVVRRHMSGTIAGSGPEELGTALARDMLSADGAAALLERETVVR